MMYTDNKHSWTYALFSAHIHRYLPALPWAEHSTLYQRWKAYHQPQPFHATLHWDTSLLGSLQSGPPRILVLFHLGMHAFLPQVLAEAGIQFDLLLDRKVFARHQTLFAALQQERQEQGACFRFLMSDDPQVLLKARSAIKAGRHLLIFADGNSGTSDQIDKKVKISFLANDLFVRKGIALLSALLGTSILPISHRTVAGKQQLLLGTAIEQLPNEKREIYIQRSMQLLYDFLADQIRNEPWRWECWGYLHKLNCYQIEAFQQAEFDLASEGNISIVLEGRKGVFNREYFCCLFV
ncbi:hypothetical protein ACLCDV_18915 [Sphingobacterium sp. Lzh-3]|uniref:hypothetical protein n=1 Tax=Sphingobacterium sp. Lzh-3 TaxID=3382150 RepID=UPI00398D2A19